jgi:eukaryotic-like serine/threonine-protein kinase
VYSLGVVLYELLTGRRPYRLKTRSLGDLARAIAEQDPVRPSATADLGDDAGATVRRGLRGDRRGLRGDLDAIVLKALRKEPAQRYGSVEQLAADLRRHRSGLPVMASDGTLGYVCGKFVRRHATAVVAAVIVVVTLLAGIGITSWEAHRARVQQERADRRFNDVRRLANAVLFPLHDAIRPLPGSTAARKLLVEEALTYLDSLAVESAGDPSLQLELARAYERVGEIQGNVLEANVGESGLAVASYRKAVEICQGLMHASDDPAARREFVTAAVSLSRTLWGVGDTANAKVYAERAREVADAELVRRPGDLQWRESLAAALAVRGFLEMRTGETSEAAAILLRAAGLYEALAAERPADRGYQKGFSANLNNAGLALAKSGRFDEGRTHLRRAVTVTEALVKANPDDLDGRRRLLVTYGELGLSLQSVDPHAALDYHRRELQLAASLTAADPVNTRARRDLANTSVAIAKVLMKTGDDAAAFANAAKGVSLLEGLVEQDPSNASAKWFLGDGYLVYGTLFLEKRQWVKALAAYDKGLAALRALLAVDRGNADAQRTLCAVIVKVATAKENAGDRDGAILSYREAADMAESLKRANPHDIAAKRGFLEAAVGLGRTNAALAGVAGSPASLRAERWRESHTWYRRGEAAGQELMNERAIDASVVDVADIRRGLTESGKALAAIEQGGNTTARR